MKRLIVAAAVVCAAGYAYAAAPARRVTGLDRALALRAKYNPFTMQRTPPAPAPAPVATPVPVPVPVPARATPARVAATPAPAPVPVAAPAAAPAPAPAPAVVRVSGAVVRPPYRPSTRSPYQPPVRGPYLATTGR